MGMFSEIDLLDAGMQASWMRNKVILNNIANVDTPNFKSSEYKFESYFARALNPDEEFPDKRTRDTHMKLSLGDEEVPGTVVRTDTTQRMDGNNVDIDRETTDFAKNVIFYNTLIRKLNGQITSLQTAIRGQ